MTDFTSLGKAGQEKAKMQTVGDIVVMSSEALHAQTKAEVDMQVATAKQYPRNLQQVLSNIEFLATQDKETAESCFYALMRDGKRITGATVRLAEIISSCWGNIRSQATIIANDGRTITAKGTCWDLESNVAYSVEVRRKITDRNGNTYSEELQIVSANAACSVALRNAVFKCVPQAITHKIQERIKDVILGSEDTFEDTRQKALKHFIDLKVTKGQILKVLGRERVEHITRDDVFMLRGLVTAINDGDITLKQAFDPKRLPKKKGLSAKLQMNEEEEEIAATEILSETEEEVSEVKVQSKTTTKKSGTK
jgi:hypothetical protein